MHIDFLNAPACRQNSTNNSSRENQCRKHLKLTIRHSCPLVCSAAVSNRFTFQCIITNDFRSRKQKLQLFARLQLQLMVILIEIPFFLSLFVSFYKDCLILKCNDFILIIFQILLRNEKYFWCSL